MFERTVARNLDRVIGLKISAEPSDHASGFYCGVSDRQFVTYMPPNAQTEIVANEGFRWEHGAYVFDGFFLVKSGGMHQGTISYGLEPVSEAVVRLGRGITIRRVTLR